MRRNFTAPMVRIFGSQKNQIVSAQEMPVINAENVMKIQDQYANIDTGAGEYVNPSISNELYMNPFEQHIPPRNI